MLIELTGASAPKVPSLEASNLSGHLHGWLYRISHEERRLTDPQCHLSPFAAWLMACKDPGVLQVRVSWFAEQYAYRALALLAKEGSALIGNKAFCVNAIKPLAREPVGPQDLLNAAALPAFVDVIAITPVVFRRNGRPHVTLDPIEVLRSAETRWQRLWPGTLPYTSLDSTGRELNKIDRSAWDRWHRIPIAKIEARSIQRSCGLFTETGILGSVTYAFSQVNSKDHKRLALSLLRGAELFGLGSRVAYGFGGIKVVPKDRLD